MRAKASHSLYIPAPKLNQLHILKEIAADPDITQAELARRCTLSVAMVNNYMKELCDLGFLEYRRKNSKTISYYVTAAGREAAEATRKELLHELIKLLADAKEQVRELIMSQAHGELRRVVLYGTGILAEIAFHALESANVKVIGICSDDPAELGQEWCGRERINSSQIRYMAPEAVVIALLERSDDVYLSLTHLFQYGIDIIRLDCRTSGVTTIKDGPAWSATALG
ncbi:MAG: winged helix-turn-helix domain-containing protein [Acidobacteriia bacterium]|nr:winged helix-turn-helix domain-containing protein [Terriglobia bacterium]